VGAGVFIWAEDQDTGEFRPLECNDQGALKVDAGVAGVWEHIETKTLASDTARSGFSGLSTDYNFFRLTMFVKTTYINEEVLHILFNDDEAANYNCEVLRAVGSNVYAASYSDLSYGYVGYCHPGYFVMVTIHIQNKAAGDNKVALCQIAEVESQVNISSIRWANTSSKITEIDFLFPTGDLAVGSKFILEGTKE